MDILVTSTTITQFGHHHPSSVASVLDASISISSDEYSVVYYTPLMLLDTPFIISKHGNSDGVFSLVSLAVNLGMVTFSMLERLVVGVQENSRLLPQMN